MCAAWSPTSLRGTRCRRKPQRPAKPVPVEIDFGAYRDRRSGGVRPQHAAADGGRRQGHCPASSSAPNGKDGPLSIASEVTEAAKLFAEIAQHWVSDPAKLAETHAALVRDYLQLAGATAAAHDGRRRRRPWRSPSPATTASTTRSGAATPTSTSGSRPTSSPRAGSRTCSTRPKGLDERTRQRAEFYLKQLASALSPSNFPLTNPEVLRETFASSGKNLVQGMANLVHDMEKSGDLLSISQTDVEAFEVGRNVATAPGQGRVPERPAAAHPVRADHRDACTRRRC